MANTNPNPELGQATENGELILALDPERFFGDREAFADRVEELLGMLQGRLPGDRRLARRAAAAATGSVEVDASLWSAVSELSGIKSSKSS